MSVFAPLSEAQFQQLAMGKARGFTWTTMADQLSLPLEVVERVPWTHEKWWNRHLAKAERLVAREAIAEVAGALRRDVREVEPKLRPTIANSLARILKLQQEYAPHARCRPTASPAPNMAPVPVVPSASPSEVVAPTPASEVRPLLAPLPSLKEMASAALVGLFLLVCAFLMGCWNSQRPLRTDDGFSEVVVLREGPSESWVTIADLRPETPIVLRPPPWVREHPRPHQGAT